MRAVAEDARALLVALEAERRTPPAERDTGASDEGLDAVAGVLHEALQRTDGGAGLAGVISRTVTDDWSLTSQLAERLVVWDGWLAARR